ncbi:MAG TPA: 2-amino-4-hydroxy-6-hydroxymethyldihydropteridine diphosphokinase [Sphingomonas sp.]|nr:2-amino-4-hydroxy-6-hydroxymethyldihydropteridine diphosphokinase [Sphingomonas sp.]
MIHRYAIGIGSNRRHGRWGRPEQVVKGAIAALRDGDVGIVAVSPIIQTAPVGAARRRFANAAMLVEASLSPNSLLALLKSVERAFGRRRGIRWGDRVLDLDILLWSGGRWADRALLVPHPRLVARRFALDPLARIAPEWRISGLGTVRQMTARLTRPRPAHRSGRRSGP